MITEFVGISGVGKSTLARQYYKDKKNKDVVSNGHDISFMRNIVGYKEIWQKANQSLRILYVIQGG